MNGYEYCTIPCARAYTPTKTTPNLCARISSVAMLHRRDSASPGAKSKSLRASCRRDALMKSTMETKTQRQRRVVICFVSEYSAVAPASNSEPDGELA